MVDVLLISRHQCIDQNRGIFIKSSQLPVDFLQLSNMDLAHHGRVQPVPEISNATKRYTISRQC